MRSTRYFIPGAKYNLRKLISYNSYYQKECYCFKESYKRFTTAGNDPNSISNTLRISNLIKINIGGRTRFGNNYLIIESRPLIDSLGSVEGQPGGSFTPLRNRF